MLSALVDSDARSPSWCRSLCVAQVSAREAASFSRAVELKEVKEQLEELQAALEAANATHREMLAREARNCEALRHGTERIRSLQVENDQLRPLRLRAQEAQHVAKRATERAERLSRQKETLELRLRSGSAASRAASDAGAMRGGGGAFAAGSGGGALHGTMVAGGMVSSTFGSYAPQSGSGIITRLESPFAPPLKLPGHFAEKAAAAGLTDPAVQAAKLTRLRFDLDQARSDLKVVREEAAEAAAAELDSHTRAVAALQAELTEAKEDAALSALEAATATAERALLSHVLDAQIADERQAELQVRELDPDASNPDLATPCQPDCDLDRSRPAGSARGGGRCQHGDHAPA